MTEPDITPEDIARVAEALGITTNKDGKTIAQSSTFFSVFTYKPIEDGTVGDDWYRFMLHQGSDARIYKELNSKTLVVMEVKRLREAGYEVHLMNAPRAMSVEAREKRHAEFTQLLQSGMPIWEVWKVMAEKAAGDH